MDTEGTAALRDVDHAVDELGDILRQRRELVDHDHQARWSVRIPTFLQLEQVLRLPLGQDVLPPAQFRSQRDEGPSEQMRRQVGDHPDRMRKPGAVTERRPALVIDEEERHPLRAVGGGQAHHPGLEKLRLAGPGGPTDQGVRAMSAQIEIERAFGAHTHQRGELMTGSRPVVVPDQ
jgi:hypothetical protein